MRIGNISHRSDQASCIPLLADLVDDLTKGIHKVVTGLSVSELTWQPDAEGNSIGVTVWHISRGLDVLKVRFLSAQLESVRLFAREYIGT